MFNKDKTEKQLLYSEIERLKKVNRKLADENRRLRENSDKTEQYRKEYETLINHMIDLKKKYSKYIEIIENIEKEYHKELERKTRM